MQPGLSTRKRATGANISLTQTIPDIFTQANLQLPTQVLKPLVFRVKAPQIIRKYTGNLCTNLSSKALSVFRPEELVINHVSGDYQRINGFVIKWRGRNHE